jgi:uncharacterized protein (TIGR02996 family)
MHAALLAEVLADPRALAPRRVYADALLEAGDPRGELIQLQCALDPLDADDPSRAALEARATDLLALHEPAWTRELRERCGLDDYPSQLGFRRGFIESARLRASRLRVALPLLMARAPLRELGINFREPVDFQGIDLLGDVPGLMELETLSLHGSGPGDDHVHAFAGWPHRGQLRSLRVDRGPSAARAIAATPGLAGLEHLSLAACDGPEVAVLAAAPHLASLRALRLRHLALDGAMLEALGRSEGLRSLEALDLGATQTIGAPPGAAALAGLGRLRELRCRGRAFQPETALALATAAARSLEVLDVDGVQLGGEGVRAFLHGGGALTRLRHLDVSDTGLVDDDLAGGARRAGFAGLIDALEVPGLRRLACAGNRLGAKAAAALAASRALGELQRLLLPRCPLGDAGVKALAASRHLPALRVLDLSATECGPDALAMLGASELGARLVSLDLGDNRLGAAGLGALLAARRLDRLEHLDLGGAALPPMAIRALAASPLAARLRSLSVSRLGSDAAAELARAEFPELRTLVTGDLDDRAASLLAGSRNKPRLQRVVLRAPLVTDDGARALADAAGFDQIAWLELDARGVGELGRAALTQRFGYRVGVFAGGSLHAFSSLSRRF